MEIKIIRKEFTETHTIGDFFIDGEFFCYTLEGVRNVDCIPYGRYKVIVNDSNGVMMPLLIDVPGFKEVRVYKEKVAAGDIVIGLEKEGDAFRFNKIAFDQLADRLDGHNYIYITIV